MIGGTGGGLGTGFGEKERREVVEGMEVDVLGFEKMVIWEVDEKVDGEEKVVSDE